MSNWSKRWNWNGFDLKLIAQRRQDAKVFGGPMKEGWSLQSSLFRLRFQLRPNESSYAWQVSLRSLGFAFSYDPTGRATPWQVSLRSLGFAFSYDPTSRATAWQVAKKRDDRTYRFFLHTFKKVKFSRKDAPVKQVQKRFNRAGQDAKREFGVKPWLVNKRLKSEDRSL